MEIIAHRGASDDAPENTLAAVRLACEQGADAVEVDLRLTKDGEVVVIHDETTQRTAGSNRAVAEQSLAEIKILDAGRWKGHQWIGEAFPTLTELLDIIPGGKRLFLEIKGGAEILPCLARELSRSAIEVGQLVLISFSFEVVRSAKAGFPGIEVYWIVGFDRLRAGASWVPSIENLIERASSAGLDGLDLDAKGPIDHTMVQRVHAAHLKVFVWTVDEASEAERLRTCGVDGLATNRPGWLRRQLDSLAGA